MTLALASLSDSRATTERKPGDFQRHPTTGAPYVSHPTETTAKGMPKRVMYGRPSGFGGALDNPYNLLKWKERELVTGIAKLDVDWSTVDLTDRDTLDKLVNQAYDAAQTMLSADRGSHIHLLTEAHDRGDDPTVLWPAGVELGLPVELQRHIINQWAAFRTALGVEALAIEATVVHDDLHLAGTLDRLDLATRRIVTSLGNIAKGNAFIGDVKTGSLVVDNTGAPKWWVKFPVQVSIYADSVPYDTDTDLRGDWPIPPHRKIALIYHYDLSRALDGELVEWAAIPVSLANGRAGAQAAHVAKQFRPVFGDPIALAPSVPQEVPCSTITSISDPATATPAATAITPTPEPTTTTPSPTITNTTVTTGSASTTTPTDHALILATQMLDWPEHVRVRLARLWPSDTPTPGSVRRGDTTWTDLQLALIRVLCGQVDAPWDTAPTEGINRWTTENSSNASSDSADKSTKTSANSTRLPHNSSSPPHSLNPPPTNSPAPPPADGGPLDPKALDALLAACTQDETRMVINAWLAESRNAGVYWNPRIVGTVRSFEQARAARALATMWWDEADDADEFVRCILATALATTASQFPVDVLPIGVVIGELTIGEACAVCDTVDAINTERLTLRYTDDGVPQLVGSGT